MALGTGDVEAPRALTRAKLELGEQSPGVPRLRIPARGRDLAALSPLAASSVPTKTVSGEEGTVEEAAGRKDRPGLQRRVPEPRNTAQPHITPAWLRRSPTSLQLLARVKCTLISPYRSLGKRVLSGGSQLGQLSRGFHP